LRIRRLMIGVELAHVNSAGTVRGKASHSVRVISEHTRNYVVVSLEEERVGTFEFAVIGCACILYQQDEWQGGCGRCGSAVGYRHGEAAGSRRGGRTGNGAVCIKRDAGRQRSRSEGIAIGRRA